MKTILLAFLLGSFCLAQERSLIPSRLFQPFPQLSFFNGTEYATGIVQTPDLQVLMLSDIGWPPIPAGSTVGIYGSNLMNNGVTKLWLSVNGWPLIVDATVFKLNIPSLEMVVFHLPTEVHGDVWVTTVGRRPSNPVRLTVE